MKLIPNGTRPSKRASSDWFTGEVWQDPVVEAPAPANLRALIVTFAPGARTHWHTHPCGQTLYVLQGQGLVCRKGELPQVISAGDTVWFDPGEEHWHGAGPDTQMVHMAMQEANAEGRVADWLDAVTNTDYTRHLQTTPST